MITRKGSLAAGGRRSAKSAGRGVVVSVSVGRPERPAAEAESEPQRRAGDEEQGRPEQGVNGRRQGRPLDDGDVRV